MEEARENSSLAYAFDFSGAHLCLDFTNTLGDRLMEQPQEHLHTYFDLLAWSQQAKLLDAEQSGHLREVAQHKEQEAQRIFEEAIEIRELFERVFLALAEDGHPETEDLDRLKGLYERAIHEGHLSLERDHYHWVWEVRPARLDMMLWLLIKEAIALLTSKEVGSVRVCAADDCNWLFLDTSKNHSRRWCDMKSCGNRAKVRRFYGKKKQELA